MGSKRCISFSSKTVLLEEEEQRVKEEKARQEKLKEDLRQQKEDLRDGSSSSSYDYEYIDGGDAQGYGEGTLWLIKW